jgi:hypothetical protein
MDSCIRLEFSMLRAERITNLKKYFFDLSIDKILDEFMRKDTNPTNPTN